jgi:hypothetical protein
MTGQIVGITRGLLWATGSVRVNEGDGRGPVEYTATVPAVDREGKDLSAAEIKAALVAAWQAQRAARPAPPQDLSGQIGGTVNL